MRQRGLPGLWDVHDHEVHVATCIAAFAMASAMYTRGRLPITRRRQNSHVFTIRSKISYATKAGHDRSVLSVSPCDHKQSHMKPRRSSCFLRVYAADEPPPMLRSRDLVTSFLVGCDKCIYFNSQ